MSITSKTVTITLSLLLVLTLSSCAKVGSERWCKNMEEKPKGDWTANEAADYAKHCIFE
jgi:hypothetical protein